MVRFEDALDVRALDDGRNWLVLEDFYYDTDVSCGSTPSSVTHRLKVQAGFITDFASIPRPLWGLVGGPADGKYRKAAVLHDWLYRTPHIATRSQADQVLLEAMRVSGCSWFQRTVIYSGVRIGGGSSYQGGL